MSKQKLSGAGLYLKVGEDEDNPDTIRVALCDSMKRMTSGVPHAVSKLLAASEAAVREARLLRYEARKTSATSQSQRGIRPVFEAVVDEVEDEESADTEQEPLPH